jgi:hypothetical protein
MRGLLWIVGIALLGFGALFGAWRLLPTEARDRSVAATARPADAPDEDATSLAPVEPQDMALRAAPQDDPPRRSSPPPPDPDGFEDGGATQAARPLPDFSAKYEGALRSDLLLAARELEAAIEQARKALTPAETADLDGRLRNQPVDPEPTPRVAALLAQIDEQSWLVGRLTRRSERPDSP